MDSTILQHLFKVLKVISSLLLNQVHYDKTPKKIIFSQCRIPGVELVEFSVSDQGEFGKNHVIFQWPNSEESSMR